MFIIFIKKYWSQIANIVLIATIIIGYKIMSGENAQTKMSYMEQSQKAQVEFSAKLSNIIIQKTDNEQKMITEINEVNKQSQLQIQQIVEDHNKMIVDLTNKQAVAVQNIAQQKRENIKVRIGNSYSDPDKVADETAKKFGFEVNHGGK